MSYREIFSERFSSLRIKSGISRSQMGKILGVSNEAIRLMEIGTRAPGFEMFLAIADYFNVSLDYLTGRDSKEE